MINPHNDMSHSEKTVKSDGRRKRSNETKSKKYKFLIYLFFTLRNPLRSFLAVVGCIVLLRTPFVAVAAAADAVDDLREEKQHLIVLLAVFLQLGGKANITKQFFKMSTLSKCWHYQNVGTIKICPVYKKLTLSKCQHYQNVNTFKCQHFQNVNSFKMLTLSICGHFQNVNTFKMSTLSECQHFQNVNTIKMSTLSKCRHYQNVDTFRMSTLSKCPHFQNANTFKMSTLPDCQHFQNVDTNKMWTLSKCQHF